VRTRTLKKVTIGVEEFAARVKSGARVRKQQIFHLTTKLNATFCWKHKGCESFAAYGRAEGWDVVESAIEAELRIARMGTLLFQGFGISAGWRPGDFDHVAGQSIVLGVVSRNDYNRIFFSFNVSSGQQSYSAIHRFPWPVGFLLHIFMDSVYQSPNDHTNISVSPLYSPIDRRVVQQIQCIAPDRVYP